MILKMTFTLKNTEAKKSVSMATSIAIAILATALTFPTMTTAAFAQSSNDFQDFMECLFNDVGGSAATAQDVENVLQGDSADVTEQEIRDCFSPIYNAGSTSEDNAATSNSNNDNDVDDDETDSTDETDNTEGEDTTEGSDGTDTSGSDDTNTENTDNTDSAEYYTQ
jgi:hypothetical protein